MNNAQFNERVNELWAQTKAGNLPRPSRFEAIEALTEEYFVANGKMPDAGALDRLSTLCLYEEVTDPHPDKMTRDEYPIMSATQEEERKSDEVLTDFSDEDDDTNENHSRINAYLASDGRSYRKPSRRTRTIGELIKMDYDKYKRK
ncbi:hypothetical protein MHI57_24650 [Cytobacillus sp. FSL K6-0129]|uniref:hypothetical protein n=1 Tax=Cytobacillus sp. FSL K6-0129 TaxID=2921421 RepID=UPI0030FAB407